MNGKNPELKDGMAYCMGIDYYLRNFYIPKSQSDEIVTEDAEYEIIEPKQLPEPKTDPE